jgi:hypothetical protein
MILSKQIFMILNQKDEASHEAESIAMKTFSLFKGISMFSSVEGAIDAYCRIFSTPHSQSVGYYLTLGKTCEWFT